MQNLDAQGKLFVFNQKEEREKTQLNRTQSLADQSAAYAAAAQADATAAVTGYVSTVGGMASSGAFSGATGTTSLGNTGNTNSSTGGGQYGISPTLDVYIPDTSNLSFGD